MLKSLTQLTCPLTNPQASPTEPATVMLLTQGYLPKCSFPAGNRQQEPRPGRKYNDKSVHSMTLSCGLQGQGL